MRITIDGLRDGSAGIELHAMVTSVSEPRKVNTKTGEVKTVADTILEDHTGKIKFTLWEEKVKLVTAGSRIKIEGAYVTSFRGELQLNLKRDSTLEVITE